MVDKQGNQFYTILNGIIYRNGKLLQCYKRNLMRAIEIIKGYLQAKNIETYKSILKHSLTIKEGIRGELKSNILYGVIYI